MLQAVYASGRQVQRREGDVQVADGPATDYGERAIQVVSKNPYRLARDIRGIGFHSADQLAARLGIAPDSPFRLGAGLSHVLEEALEQGHCALPRDELIQRTAESA